MCPTAKLFLRPSSRKRSDGSISHDHIQLDIVGCFPYGHRTGVGGGPSYRNATELPGIHPREVAVVSVMCVTLFGLGFAVGPVIVGIVAQVSGSAQTGLIVFNGLTGPGALAGVY